MGGLRGATLAASILLASAAVEARTQGTFHFRPLDPIVFEVGADAGRQSFVLGDVNHDDRPDLVVINIDEEELGVMLGHGDGTFDAPQIYDLDGTPTALAIADLASPFASDAAGDIDGHPDVVVAFDDGSAEIYLGRGDGGFDPPEQDLVDVLDASELIGIVVDDFDGNGRLDLGLLDLFEEVYFLCNVDGNFAPCATDVLDTQGQGSLAMVGGDFDHDMHRDLAVLNLDSYDLSPIFGNGDGSFADVEQTIPTSAAGDQEPRDLAVGRLDGDATDDLLVGNHEDFDDVNAVAIYGAGNRALTTSAVAVPFELSALALVDLDLDGALDFVAIEDEPASTAPLVVGRGDGTGGFDLGVVAAGAPMGPARALSVVDLDGNTKLDVVVLRDDGTSLQVAINETPDVCAGDCNANDAVSIDELVLGVGIALGNRPIAGCTAFDLDGSKKVEINELVAAVARALRGCPV
jgi:hypothetical protein